MCSLKRRKNILTIESDKEGSDLPNDDWRILMRLDISRPGTSTSCCHQWEMKIYMHSSVQTHFSACSMKSDWHASYGGTEWQKRMRHLREFLHLSARALHKNYILQYPQLSLCESYCILLTSYGDDLWCLWKATIFIQVPVSQNFPFPLL